MVQILFTNARVFDGNSAERPESMQVLVEGEQLPDISLLAADSANMRVIVRNGAVLKNQLH